MALNIVSDEEKDDILLKRAKEVGYHSINVVGTDELAPDKFFDGPVAIADDAMDYIEEVRRVAPNVFRLPSHKYANLPDDAVTLILNALEPWEAKSELEHIPLDEYEYWAFRSREYIPREEFNYRTQYMSPYEVYLHAMLGDIKITRKYAEHITPTVLRELGELQLDEFMAIIDKAEPTPEMAAAIVDYYSIERDDRHYNPFSLSAMTSRLREIARKERISKEVEEYFMILLEPTKEGGFFSDTHSIAIELARNRKFNFGLLSKVLDFMYENDLLSEQNRNELVETFVTSMKPENVSDLNMTIRLVEKFLRLFDEYNGLKYIRPLQSAETLVLEMFP